MTWFIRMQAPRPQAGRSVRHTHESACADAAPCFVALPPPFSDAMASAVLIARLTVQDRLVRPLGPHGRKTIWHVITHFPGLAGLEVQPIGVLMFVVAVMGSIVDSGGLTVRVPGVDLPTAGRNLWFGTGAIATGQVDGRAGTEPRDQVSAVARIIGKR